MAHIKIKSVSAFYDSLKVLDDLSLDINKGEIVSLIGPSGSGKSTLLKLLVGLVKFRQGEVFLEEKKINYQNTKDLSFVRSKIAIVFWWITNSGKTIANLPMLPATKPINI
jgi:polar amino acid transport system ATP-binding protein